MRDTNQLATSGSLTPKVINEVNNGVRGYAEAAYDADFECGVNIPGVT